MSSIRSFDLLDLRTLYRYRDEAVSLDTARLLTRGNPLGPRGAMAYVNPRRHVYSAVCTDDGVTLVGGIIHTIGETFARLLYLAPASGMQQPGMPSLIEHLATEAGKWGAFHVVAELPETGEAFQPLRRAGFSAYASQRFWEVGALGSREATGKWRRAASINLPAIQGLHHQILPPLLQAVEPAPKRAVGFFSNEGNASYVSTSSGFMGIVLFPLIHPETKDVATKLRALIYQLPKHSGRPVFVCVRSYQAWLEHVLEDIGGQAGERQAVMVKYLTRPVREEQTVRAAQPASVSVQPSRVSHIVEKKRSL